MDLVPRVAKALVDSRQRWLLFFFVWLLLLPSEGRAEQGRAVLHHAVLVAVNGVKITQEDLDLAAEFIFKQQYPNRSLSSILEDEADALSETALRELIKSQLIKDEAEKMKLSVSLSELEEIMRKNGLDPRAPNPMGKRFTEADLLFDMICRELGLYPVKPGPREIRAFYEKHQRDIFQTKRLVQVRHIYVDATTTSVESARSQAEMLHRLISTQPPERRSEFFANTAKEFSQDRFRSEGGLLRLSNDPEGWFNQEFPNRGPGGKPLLPEPMVRGIRKLVHPGDLSPVIQSENGFHILYLEQAKGGEQIPFLKAQHSIVRHLMEKNRRERLDKWLREKLAKSNVIWHDGDPFPPEKILPPVLRPEDVRDDVREKSPEE